MKMKTFAVVASRCRTSYDNAKILKSGSQNNFVLLTSVACVAKEVTAFADKLVKQAYLSKDCVFEFGMHIDKYT